MRSFLDGGFSGLDALGQDGVCIDHIGLADDEDRVSVTADGLLDIDACIGEVRDQVGDDSACIHDLLRGFDGNLDQVLPHLDDVEPSDGIHDPVLEHAVGNDGDCGCGLDALHDGILVPQILEQVVHLVEVLTKKLWNV